MRERIAIVRGNGSGWQNYKFLNPVTRQVKPKTMFVQRFDDMIVGCGIHLR